MKLSVEIYDVQTRRWPTEGRHILAHFDESSIVVYQAYRPSIARFALEHGYFGGPDFSFARMTWIKPNFLWMMYRSGWATKPGQEVILGLRLRRTFFESLLSQAVPSSYDAALFSDPMAWKAMIVTSDVRLQWDPDHSPSGIKLERRAIQLGLRGQLLNAFARSELLEVIDLTEFVASQRAHANASNTTALLRTPKEEVYVPNDAKISARIGLDTWNT